MVLIEVELAYYSHNWLRTRRKGDLVSRRITIPEDTDISDVLKELSARSLSMIVHSGLGFITDSPNLTKGKFLPTVYGAYDIWYSVLSDNEEKTIATLKNLK